MASNARNVARAMPPLGVTPGGFGGAPSTFGAQANGPISPLVASYQQWTQGRPYGGYLPRDPRTFLSGSFGPLAPIEPIGIDAPDPVSGRPEPRRWVYPTAWNMPIGTPGSEGTKLAPFATLRALADVYSVARACLSVRKQEILSLTWNISPTREAEKRMGGSNTGARKDFEKRRAEAMAFFDNPDPGKFRSFTSWLNALLEDLFVIDAPAIYLQPTRLPGKGLLGSNLKALCLIDGSTVRPLLDMQGGTPQPPNPAYQVYNFGVPRVDLATVIAGSDIEDADPDDVLAEYGRDQLLYAPYDLRNGGPYGFSLVEKALVPILSGLQKQNYQLDYFSEGSIPGIFISSGDSTATPNQLRTLQDALNAIAGDPAWKHKIIVLPGGSRIDPMRPVPLADQFDEVVMTQVCMAFDVMPMELGIAPKVSTTMSPGASNQMAKASKDVNQRKALRPVLIFLKEQIFDYILQKVCGQEDMQFTWEGLEEGEDRESLIDNLINQISHGLMSIDEARVELGEQPWGLPLTSDPVWATQTGIVPVGAIDPMSGRPMGEQLALPGTAGVAAPGGAPASAPGAQQKPAKPGAQAAAPAKPPIAPASPRASASAANVKPAKPAPRPGVSSPNTRPGGRGTPAHDSSVGKPQTPAQAGRAKPSPGKATASKAALREIDLVRRRLIKGRSIDDWEFEFIDFKAQEVLKAAGTSMEIEEAVDIARRLTKGEDRLAERDSVIATASNHVAASLGSLAQGLRQGTVTHAQFLDQGTEIMRQGIRHGLRSGASAVLRSPMALTKQEDEDGGDEEQILSGPYGDYLDSLASELGDEQGGFLQGLLQDLMAAIAISSFASRFMQYAAQVRSAFEQGFGLTALARNPDQWVVWRVTSAKPCALCADRDGKVFSASTLPGWPGDGGFAAAGTGGLCMGGPNCHCYLEAIDQGDSVDAPVNPQLTGGYAAEEADRISRLNQIRAQMIAARRAFVDSLPPDARARAMARDAAAEAIAQELGVWPSDVTADQIAQYLHDHGMDAMRQSVIGKKKKKDKKKDKKDKRDEVSLDPPKPDGPAIEVTHEDHGDHHLPDETEHVYAYLARHYPLDTIEWVKSAVWRGPVMVDLSEIQFERRPGGARNEDKVRMMVNAIHDGTPPRDPVVLVQTPSSPPFHVADGYHRLAAFHDAGQGQISAWIGKVTTETGPWGREMNQAKLNH